MRKVVDANCLGDKRLRLLLQASPANRVVLTDYVAMESYKGGRDGIFQSMEILSYFPEQVIVLKSTQVICGLKSSKKGFVKRMIDHAQTKGFSTYCAQLRRARSGASSYEAHLLDHEKEANSHLERVLEDAKGFESSIGEIAKNYTAEELRILRTGGRLSEAMIDKFVKQILLLAAYVFRDHPRVRELPNVSTLQNAFIFRFALCMYLLAIERISSGAKGIKPEHLRNDMVDMSYVAYATYFDGLLSNDERVSKIYTHARVFLDTMFT